MKTFIVFLIGLAIGYYYAKDKFAPKVEPDENELNRQRAEEKQKHLDWIMGHFSNEDEITNDKVEKLIGVSNTSAERYLNDLEKQGKLRQIGTVGQSVTYKKT